MYTLMKFVNINNLNEAKWEVTPYGHIVIDNFLNEEYIQTMLDEMSLLTEDKSYYYGNELIENTKRAFNKDLGEFINSLFDELCSDEFIDKIEGLTGIEGIIRNSKNLEGAGIHKVYNHGFLCMHKDFNNTYDKTYGLIDRRINLLIYMNPEWKEEYGGHLCLYSDKDNKIVKKILPILNRCVIFNTTDAIHGHPTPMRLPDVFCRQSLALYYYTKNTTGKSVNGKELLSVQWYDDIK